MNSVSIVAGGWAVHDVGAALSFWDRWRGMRGAGDHQALLLRTRSVHGFGLRSPLMAVGITSGMEVASVRLLRRGHIVWFPGAEFVLELPLDQDAPPVGSKVEIRDA